jgi:hypothetical protein
MIDNKRINFVCSSDGDYEKLILEVYYDDIFIFLLNQDNGIENLIIEFGNEKITLNNFEEILNMAKDKVKTNSINSKNEDTFIYLPKVNK